MSDDKRRMFWVVWCPNAYQPTKKHPSESAAKQEAERLAGQNAGKLFYVLKAIYLTESPPRVITAEMIDSDEIPF